MNPANFQAEAGWQNTPRQGEIPPYEGFTFLSLPAEVRELIYKHAMKGHITHIRRSKGTLVSASALSSVSRQVRKEFADALWHSSNFKFKVKNLRFRPLIEYLEGLTALQKKRMTGSCVLIHLELMDTVRGASLRRSLDKWSQFRATDLGRAIDCRYEATGEAREFYRYRWDIESVFEQYNRTGDLSQVEEEMPDCKAVMQAINKA